MHLKKLAGKNHWLFADINNISISTAGSARDINFAKTVICCESSKLLAQLTLLLDGKAQHLMLLPFNLSDADATALLEKFNPTIIVTDKVVFDGFGRFADETISFETCLRASVTLPDELYETLWILCTSGTTNTPKLVSHSLGSLIKTTKIGRQSDSQYVWGLLYDLARFAGLQVFLQALADGGRIVFPNLAEPLNTIITEFIREGVNCLSATPSMWRKLLSSPDFRSLPLKNITLGGEISDQKTLDTLAGFFPSAKIRHIYASTEAGVGFSVTDGQEGFPKSFLEYPPNGLSVRINGSNVLEIKRGNTDSEYVAEVGQSFRTLDGFVITGDMVEIKDDRILFIGRENGAINIGGNKVFPEQVERVLTAFPGINQAIVFPKKNPFTGYVVAAKVCYLANSANESRPFSEIKSELMQYCRAFLPTYAVPAVIQQVDEIKINSAGKLARRSE